jgi:hypothetical protein
MADDKSSNTRSTSGSGTTKFSEGQKPAGVRVQPIIMEPGAKPEAPKR